MSVKILLPTVATPETVKLFNVDIPTVAFELPSSVPATFPVNVPVTLPNNEPPTVKLLPTVTFPLNAPPPSTCKLVDG